VSIEALGDEKAEVTRKALRLQELKTLLDEREVEVGKREDAVSEREKNASTKEAELKTANEHLADDLSLLKADRKAVGKEINELDQKADRDAAREKGMREITNLYNEFKKLLIENADDPAVVEAWLKKHVSS